MRPKLKSSHIKPTKRPTQSDKVRHNMVALETLEKVLDMLNLHMDNVFNEVQGDGGQGSPMKALNEFQDKLTALRKTYNEPAPKLRESIPNERNFPREGL